MENKKILSYIDKLSIKLKLNLLVLFLALTIYTFWYFCDLESLFFYSYLHISLGHIGYVGLLLIPAFLIIENEYLQKWWIFFSGLALLDLPVLMYITNDKPIDNSIFSSSINLTILIFLFLITALYGISKSITSIDFITKKKDLWIVFFSSLFFISIYHGSNYYLKEVAKKTNDERSIFIEYINSYGILDRLEFHHINYGIILLVLVPFLFKYASNLSHIYRFLAYIFIGFIYGTVFDECFYYMLQSVNDEVYFHLIPTIASLIIMGMSFIIWFYIIKKKKDFNNA